LIPRAESLFYVKPPRAVQFISQVHIAKRGVHT
jgi:hypothetical protein